MACKTRIESEEDFLLPIYWQQTHFLCYRAIHFTGKGCSLVVRVWDWESEILKISLPVSPVGMLQEEAAHPISLCPGVPTLLWLAAIPLLYGEGLNDVCKCLEGSFWVKAERYCWVALGQSEGGKTWKLVGRKREGSEMLLSDLRPLFILCHRNCSLTWLLLIFT